MTGTPHNGSWEPPGVVPFPPGPLHRPVRLLGKGRPSLGPPGGDSGPGSRRLGGRASPAPRGGGHVDVVTSLPPCGEEAKGVRTLAVGAQPPLGTLLLLCSSLPPPWATVDPGPAEDTGLRPRLTQFPPLGGLFWFPVRETGVQPLASRRTRGPGPFPPRCFQKDLRAESAGWPRGPAVRCALAAPAFLGSPPSSELLGAARWRGSCRLGPGTAPVGCSGRVAAAPEPPLPRAPRIQPGPQRPALSSAPPGPGPPPGKRGAASPTAGAPTGEPQPVTGVSATRPSASRAEGGGLSPPALPLSRRTDPTLPAAPSPASWPARACGVGPLSSSLRGAQDPLPEPCGTAVPPPPNSGELRCSADSAGLGGGPTAGGAELGSSSEFRRPRNGVVASRNYQGSVGIRRSEAHVAWDEAPGCLDGAPVTGANLITAERWRRGAGTGRPASGGHALSASPPVQEDLGARAEPREGGLGRTGRPLRVRLPGAAGALALPSSRLPPSRGVGVALGEPRQRGPGFSLKLPDLEMSWRTVAPCPGVREHQAPRGQGPHSPPSLSRPQRTSGHPRTRVWPQVSPEGERAGKRTAEGTEARRATVSIASAPPDILPWRGSLQASGASLTPGSPGVGTGPRERPIGELSRHAAPHAAAPTRHAAPHAAAPTSHAAPHTAPPTRHAVPHAAAPTRHAAPHAAAPTRHAAPHAAAPTRHAAPHAAAPTRHAAPHAAPPTRHAAPHAAAPTRHAAPHAAAPTRHAAPHAAPPTRHAAPHAAAPTRHAAPHAAPPTRHATAPPTRHAAAHAAAPTRHATATRPRPPATRRPTRPRPPATRRPTRPRPPATRRPTRPRPPASSAPRGHAHPPRCGPAHPPAAPHAATPTRHAAPHAATPTRHAAPQRGHAHPPHCAPTGPRPPATLRPTRPRPRGPRPSPMRVFAAPSSGGFWAADGPLEARPRVDTDGMALPWTPALRAPRGPASPPEAWPHAVD
ncbi:basic proline-rich protein-like [Perognathus longimembris pacificus]|uniref:basic proline-rich protein-like n=1 Tax=Perognathus longimembris pacificus TaxID=214514 RepID=UPI002019E9B7|nr:basic proline-rich protein-like [Perognathus longimembris pacificus]